MLASSYANAQWQDNGVQVAQVTGDELDPEIISDGAGGSIIVWQTRYSYSDSPDIYAQRLDGDGYILWITGGVPVCTASGGQYKPQIVPDGAGGAIIAWTDMRDGNAAVYAQRIDDEGTTLWTTDGIPVCDTAGSYGWNMASRISMVEVPGGAIIAWFDNRNGDYDIYAQKVDAGGTVQWTCDGATICAETGDQGFYVRAVPDDAGGAIVSWIDGRGVDDDLYAQRIAPDSTLMWTMGGVPVCTATGDQREHEAVSDGSGGFIAVWKSKPVGGDEEDIDLWSQRIDAGGTPVWTSGGIPVCQKANAQLWPDLASDNAGGAFYSWSDRRNAEWYEHEIYVQHISSTGDSLWQAGGILIGEPGGGDNYITEIIPDMYGGAIVSWFTGEPLPGSFQASPLAPADEIIETIYAQRMESDGTISWQDGGVPLVNVPGLEMPRNQKLIPDGEGGAIVTWYNILAPGGIYAQRVYNTGITSADTPPLAEIASSSYPNPFNPATTIEFSLPEAGRTWIGIYSVDGRLVRSLVSEHRDEGVHRVYWDGRDGDGRVVSSGVYFCNITVNGISASHKMVLMR